MRTKTPMKLPRKGLLSLLLFSLFFTESCISSSPPGLSVPEDRTETVPRRVYALDFDSAWSRILEALEKNRIPMQLIQKKTGMMKTGYQKGADRFLLREVFATRYKFTILVLSQDPQNTIINIRCVYEIRKKSGGAFAEATTLVPQEVESLGKKMYLLIEPTLRPHEGQQESNPKTEKTTALTERELPECWRPDGKCQ